MQRDIGAAPRQRLRRTEDRGDADAAGDQAVVWTRPIDREQRSIDREQRTIHRE